MNRRSFIKSSAYGAAAMALGANELFNLRNSAWAQVNNSNPFHREFVVPPLDTGLREGNQVRFKLSMRQGESNFVGNASTPTLGINADYLGPVLRAKRGDRVSFEVDNQLNEVVALHWHGFQLPAKADGGPHQAIRPGETWRPAFDIIQGASTYWYHAHTHKQTGRQVYHGLAGLFIVDDDYSLSAGLPIDYGVNDIPVVIQDRAFSKDGSFQYLGSMPQQMHGMHGDTILVNGVVTPTLKAKSPLLRLRLLNGSNARTYTLAFHDARPFVVIAADGGFLPKPEKVQKISLATGERAEILVDLSDGRDAILVNRPDKKSSAGMMRGMMGMMGQSDAPFDIMRITAPGSTRRQRIDLPAQIIPLPAWRENTISQTRQFQLEMQMGPRMMMSRMLGGSPFSINGQSMDMNVIHHRARPNSLETWEISNNSMLAHPFHIHNTQFLVQARSDRAIAPIERGLKDTILVYPNEKVRLLVPMPAYTDSERPYMYHCHILEHEDQGMMGQFTVEAQV